MTARDKAALAKISIMRASGWSLARMTRGTGLKRSRILRLIAQKREELQKEPP